MSKTLIAIAELILVGLIVVCESSCQECSVEREFNHPTRPTNILGWKEFQDGTVTVNGDFVLTVGESIDNGKIGVRVIDLTPARCSLIREPKFPVARIQFYDVADRKVICESTFRPGNTLLNNSQMCGENFDWAGIGIGAINAKEKWVAFQLAK